MNRDLIHNLEIDQVLKPQTIQGAALNTGNIDVQGADSLLVVINVGELVDSSNDGNITLKIEEADDDGTGSPGAYAAVADATHVDLQSGLTLNTTTGVFKTLSDFGATGGSDDNAIYIVGYKGDKRFVKVTATPTDISAGGAIGMTTVKGHLAQKPASN